MRLRSWWEARRAAGGRRWSGSALRGRADEWTGTRCERGGRRAGRRMAVDGRAMRCEDGQASGLAQHWGGSGGRATAVG